MIRGYFNYLDKAFNANKDRTAFFFISPMILFCVLEFYFLKIISNHTVVILLSSFTVCSLGLSTIRILKLSGDDIDIFKLLLKAGFVVAVVLVDRPSISIWLGEAHEYIMKIKVNILSKFLIAYQ